MAEPEIRTDGRIKLAPSRGGYGVLIVAAPEETSLQPVVTVKGLLKGSSGLQFHTASHECGDASDDANGHGTHVATAAVGAVERGAWHKAEEQAAARYAGLAKGAKALMIDLSSGHTRAAPARPRAGPAPAPRAPGGRRLPAA